jgi:ERCC4-related helicase
VKYILLYQPVMWFILVQTYLKNILAQNIQIVLKEQMLKQRQMLQQVFLNLLKLLWESILERIMKINIEEMAKMVGIDMIQNLLFLYMIRR